MTALAKLAWYRNRLALMSVPEVVHRARQTVSKRLMKSGFGRQGEVPAPQGDAFGQPWCALPQGLDPAPYVQEADRLLEGRWRVFALDDAPLGFPPQWNVDPLTGTRAPLDFGKTLDYRDERRVGNIKYLWEPSRHLELVTLAQAWRLGGSPRHLQACGTLLGSWFAQCPFPMGAHWASALELAIRLVNWAVAWHLLGGAASPLFEGEAGRALRDEWLRQVWRHAQFIRGFLSRFSSANNHLLGEYMGLYVAGVTWRCWAESQEWQRMGRQGFEAEALVQNSPDGVNREQGVYYHHEVADMMLLCGLFGRANGDEFGSAYWQRLEAMIAFLAAITDAGGHVPMIGDADDALMVRFDPREGFDPYRSLRATGASLFGRDFGADARAEDDLKTRWLLGDVPAAAPPSSKRLPHAFAEGGYWVLEDRRGTPQEVRLVADAGPLGYLSLAAHGHADALSFVMSLDGQELLIDPGTYAYHTQRRWRDYFRGTSAHNTLRVDGVDQSEIGGNFMWLRKARARCIGFEHTPSRDHWVAEHDGYQRLPDPVLHRRSVALLKPQRRVEVTDILECRRAHRVELFWHFAEGCVPEAEGEQALRVSLGGRKVRLSCTDGRLSLHRGEEDPPLGWVSRRFDRKQPCWTARFELSVEGPARISTVIEYS